LARLSDAETKSTVSFESTITCLETRLREMEIGFYPLSTFSSNLINILWTAFWVRMPCPALFHFLCFVFFVKGKLSISKIDKLFLKQVAFLLLRISLILKYGAIHIIRDPFCTFSYLLHNLIFLNHCISLWTANFASKSIKIRVLKANKKFRWHFADPPRMYV